jgi:DNA topoisomerase-2
MDTLKVSIDRLNNTISVWNNGHGIPVEMHSKEGVYVPELIFGHLLTSSNYDDSEKKVTGGRNGYGAKLCNIFSKEFVVETADRASGKKFHQRYTNNMSTRTTPHITANSKNEEWTCITFRPDLAKFGMETIDDDLYSLFRKRVYDMCGSVANIKVLLNGERVKVKDFKAYTDMYLETQTPKPSMVFEKVSDRWEIGFAVSEGQFQQVSFVNSINTYKGGTHVTYLADQLVGKIQEAVKKKNKNGAPVKPFQIKNHMWLFVNCLIENPTFDSQTKENMTLKASAFGSKPSVSEDFVKKVLKSGIIESILTFAKFKQEQQMKKTDGSKKSRISGITKLDDANNAGTKNAKQCTLILTEGDSAKALAVSGLAVVGRDDFGVFPLRGKLLNVREANAKQLMENQEIQFIKQILGLQQGKVYEDTSSLRYGHIMIMTDQDHDGSHIKGLIVNFLDHFWPSLLKIPGFLQEFITPIVKVSKGKGKDRKEISFFTIPEYENWKEEHEDGKGWQIKYYKGLGTSTSEDAKKYFGAMTLHRKPFKSLKDEDRDLVDMAFNKKKADDRKDWLRRFQPGTFMDHTVREIPISDFINKELILFSVADNIRSIPNVVDGLKPGHRKIIFACFKRNLKSEIKVAQLAGYVAEHSAYHHGEASLQGTIIGLAQNFVGSNNVNLLEPVGQFGTRLQGGKDAASPRYIFTHLSPITRAIFHPADDALLKYTTEDGQKIEPEWYMPILPLLLINGAEGIGTGWSTMIPNYNPRDIVENVRRLLLDQPQVPMKPWYRGFKGSIEGEGDKFRVSGTMAKIDNNTIEVTELPIRSWTQSYKEQLEGWLVSTDKTPAMIKDYKEYHTDTSVHFVITMTDEQMAKAEAEGLEKRFKMTTVINTTNMVCFDHEGRIRKYNNVEEIVQDFYELRLQYYRKRKDHLADQLTQEWTRLDNKVRFITEIIQGKLVVQNKKKAEILAELTARAYTPFYKGKDEQLVDDADDKPGKGHGFDYLLSMPIWSLTMEKVQNMQKERDEKQSELDHLLKQSAKDLWNADLDKFLQEWDVCTFY